MSFLPKTKRQKHMLFWLILIMPWIALEVYFGAKYASKHEDDLDVFNWDTKTLWEIKPGYEGEAFNGMPILNNHAGFRQYEETPLRSERDVRIITLGDSRTYGYNVEVDEAYSKQLEKELNKLGVDAEVLNSGTHGYTAVQSRGKLEQCLKFKPDIAVFAPGYNDRRYTVARPPDSEESFAMIARGRQVLDVLSISNVFFGIIYELGQAKIKELQANAPPLDEVHIRVPMNTFRVEVNRFVDICRENDIEPVFLLIHADPYVYEDVERAGVMIEEGKFKQAKALLDKIQPTLHNYAYMLYRLYMGRYYEAMGEQAKAEEQYNMHRPHGSLHGEAVLRRQAQYYDIYSEVAAQKNVLIYDNKQLIKQGFEGLEDPQQAFEDSFIDECHYNALGHKYTGLNLARGLYEDLLD